MTKVLISVPDDLLQRIDREAKTRRLTRSRFIEDAARRELALSEPSELAAAVERARRALAGAGKFESADVVRRDRERHDAGRG
jgi:metal-responsive CopG/Arc/MetJ family transcriptional regulator